MLVLRTYQPLRLIGVAVMGAVGLCNVLGLDSYAFGLLHFVNLIPNLLGQVVFSLFGWFGNYLGGSLMQVAFPFSLFIYLSTSGQRFSSSLALFWTAQSLVEVSLYIKDARALTFDLYWGTDHIWNRLLGELGLLKLDQFLGNFILLSGVLALTSALAIGLYAAKKARL